ncbi:MAG TPA: aldehyde dehydrogenase family protein [Solirubrobacteraceae bacterium]|jgi:betaine-aldehyde dehydrogenase
MENLFIGGEYVASTAAEVIAVENPATEEVLTEVPDASATDIDRAVEAARRAQRDWRRVDHLERVGLLHTCAARLEEHADELAVLLTREGGKTLKENRDEIEWSATAFRHLGEVARASRGRVAGATKPGQLNFVLNEPLGVVAHILPFNYPIVLLAWQVAAALAAGNACIVKPSEQTPLATLRLGSVFDHLPPGLFNVITATGRGAAQLVEHPGTDMIAFTGSVAVGSRIMAAAAPRIKKLLLELGGSDPFIVLGDAKLDVAARGGMFAAFLNAGQVCTSAERFYIEAPVYDEFMGRAIEEIGSLRVGDPFGDVDVGALISGAARDQVSRVIAEITDLGANVVRGGQPPSDLNRGYFYEPTLIELTDPERQRFEAEIFGPLATVTRVRDLDHAIELANGSNFGLGANIYTASLETAMRAATELQAGTVWVNDPLKDNDAAPFGGMKFSGLGRELGPEGITAFTQSKHVHVDFGQVPSPEWWFPYQRPAIDEAAAGTAGEVLAG